MVKKLPILLEHDETPGTSYPEEYLLFGACGDAILNEMISLNEAADPTIKVVKFRGKFQEADTVNKNKRSYPYSILDENVKRLREAIENGGLCGELDHPTDSIIHFTTASHKITKLWWEGNILMGEGQILNTPNGKVLRALINDGVRIGISSRGVGSGRVNEDGVLVIGESYKLITFDSVADPSTHAAFQEKYVNGKRECVTPEPIVCRKPSKNEASSIHTPVSKEMLIASLGGIIRNKVNEIKERLN